MTVINRSRIINKRRQEWETAVVTAGALRLESQTVMGGPGHAPLKTELDEIKVALKTGTCEGVVVGVDLLREVLGGSPRVGLAWPPGRGKVCRQDLPWGEQEDSHYSRSTLEAHSDW